MQRIAEATWNVPSWSRNILRIVQWEQDCQQRSRQQNVTGSNKWGYMITRSKWASVSCTYASGHQEGRSSGAGEEPARMFLAVLQTWRKSRFPIRLLCSRDCPGFVGFKQLCPGDPQNFFSGCQLSRFFSPISWKYDILTRRTNILTLKRWEKSTSIGRWQTATEHWKEAVGEGDEGLKWDCEGYGKKRQ